MLLLCATVLAEAGQQAPAANGPLHHTCGATDKQFIQVARLNVDTVTSLGQDYLDGEAKGTDVVSAASDGAEWVTSTQPVDPSLRVARRYLRAMFLEYAKAVHVRMRGGNPAPAMYRTYDMDEQVRDTLKPAQATLSKLGCDVTDLL